MLLISQSAHFCDGAMDVCLATGGSRLDNVSLLLGLEDGSHVAHENCKYFKASHCVLEPIDRESLVDVDGERYACAPTFVSVLPGYASLAC